MRPRFYLPEIDSSRQGELAADETAHLVRVLRLGVGAEIDVLDGRGHMFHAKVVELARATARVEVVGPAPSAPEPGVHVTLVMSVLKGDKMDDVIRDAAMMGVGAVQPLVPARSEVSLAALARARRAERWTRIAVASVKQCGRAVVPAIQQPLGTETWVARRQPEPVVVLQEPSRGAARRLRDVARAAAVQLLVGPEGGWSEEECATFEAAGFHAASLGGRTLRADAAPIVALAALYEAWNAW